MSINIFIVINCALQMIPAQIFRLIHTNGLLWQASNKSLLAKLRKKTGYTFANCKKALELHENDVNKVREHMRITQVCTLRF